MDTTQHMSRNDLGRWGENLAADHLRREGWSILARNWRTRGGELDLVAFDPERNAIVGVEVKTRRSHRAGTPEESVTAAKIQRIRGLLLHWIMGHGGVATLVTIDVIAVDISPDGAQSLVHLKDVAS